MAFLNSSYEINPFFNDSGKISICGARVTIVGSNTADLSRWVEMRAIPWLQKEIFRIGLCPKSKFVLTLGEFRYSMHATNDGRGRLHVSAISSSLATYDVPNWYRLRPGEDMVVVNGTVFLCCSLPKIGTKVRVNLDCNELIGTVVGYSGVPLDQKGIPAEYCRLGVLVDLENPPTWLIESKKSSEAREDVLAGRLPVSDVDHWEPNKKSDEFKRWNENWKMGPILFLDCKAIGPNETSNGAKQATIPDPSACSRLTKQDEQEALGGVGSDAPGE